jgi:hypothetical protein
MSESDKELIKMVREMQKAGTLPDSVKAAINDQKHVLYEPENATTEHIKKNPGSVSGKADSLSGKMKGNRAFMRSFGRQIARFLGGGKGFVSAPAPGIIDSALGKNKDNRS